MSAAERVPDLPESSPGGASPGAFSGAPSGPSAPSARPGPSDSSASAPGAVPSARSASATGAIPSALEQGARFASFEEAYRVLTPLMEAIAAVVGPHCEVVLHDLSRGDLDSSVAAIVNGDLSGRTVGGPSTNLGAEVLRDPGIDHDAHGYRGRTADGRELTSSSVYYRDLEGHIIAAFCINVDLTPVQTAMNALGALVPEVRQDVVERPKELVGPDIATMLDDLVEEAIATVGKPVPSLTKPERIRILRLLEERGAFRIKRAADTVSARLGVSRVTVYGYLDEVRRG